MSVGWVMMGALMGSAQATEPPAEDPESPPVEENIGAVDVIEALDRFFEAAAGFVHVGEDDSVELGDGLVHWDGQDRLALFDEWFVAHADGFSLGRGWLVVDDSATRIGGWTLPFGGPLEVDDAASGPPST